MAALRRYVIPCLLVLGLVAECWSQIQLDDRFLEQRKQGIWLVKFYAPWCGYCKKLEPVFQEVARELEQAKSPINVAKIDCTKYSNIATEFSIRGFPTILFINGDRVFTHKGDRTKENIMEFALRAQGPTIRKLTSVEQFNEVFQRHGDSAFFVYLRKVDPLQDDLFKIYSQVAENYAIQSYFYYGDKHIIENLNIQQYPTVFAVKDAKFYEFHTQDSVSIESSLQQFVSRERFASFPKILGASLNDLVGAVKYLVILAVEAQELEDPDTSSARLFQVMKDVAFTQRDKLHSQFQFLWMDNLETVNTIALSFLATPAFMVMETESRLYYMTPLAVNFTATTLVEYLTRVAEDKEQAYGGTSFLMRLRRMLFDFLSLIINIWQTSRWLFLLIVIPITFLMFICYAVCCMETSGYEDESDSEDEDDEEEKDASLPPVVPWPGQLPPYSVCDSGDKPFNKIYEKKTK